MCRRLASTENGASPRLSLAIGIWCFSAKAISASREREIPFAPRRDHFDVGLERVIGELEAHLVVALAGRAMRHGVGADLLGDLDLLLGDQRPRDRGAEQILALIERVGAEHREHVVAHEFFAQIFDEDVLRLDAEHQRLLARRLELLALAEIGGEGHHLAAIGRLQPFEDDRGVEPARIGEHDFLDVAFLSSSACEILCAAVDGRQNRADYRRNAQKRRNRIRPAAHRERRARSASPTRPVNPNTGEARQSAPRRRHRRAARARAR